MGRKSWKSKSAQRIGGAIRRGRRDWAREDAKRLRRLAKRQRRLGRTEKRKRYEEKQAQREASAPAWTFTGRRLDLEDAQLYLSGRGRNPLFVPAPAVDGSIEIVAPSSLNLSGERRATLEFLRDIRQASLKSAAREVFVDLKSLAEISPAAAVLLVAELHRCAKLSRGSGRHIRGRWPDNEGDAVKVLIGLGAAPFLGVQEPKNALEDKERRWFQLLSQSVVPRKEIYQLLMHYKPYIDVNREWQSKFYRALGDATSNVIEHAYPPRSEHPYLLRHWWLAGIVAEGEGILNFVFWDQGVGIPATMRTRPKSGLFSELRGMDDATLIDVATRVGESRHRDGRRGHGLRALIELIDLAPGGVLRICAGSGVYIYEKDTQVHLENHGDSVGGTLIIWTVRI